MKSSQGFQCSNQPSEPQLMSKPVLTTSNVPQLQRVHLVGVYLSALTVRSVQRDCWLLCCGLWWCIRMVEGGGLLSIDTTQSVIWLDLIQRYYSGITTNLICINGFEQQILLSMGHVVSTSPLLSLIENLTNWRRGRI